MHRFKFFRPSAETITSTLNMVVQAYTLNKLGTLMNPKPNKQEPERDQNPISPQETHAKESTHKHSR